MVRFCWLLCFVTLAFVVGCANPPAMPTDVHILPADNHGCEIICRDGLCTITCPYKGGCKPEGEAVCVVEGGQMRIRPTCCPVYVACRGCKCLRDGTYKGRFQNGVCTFQIRVGR